MCGLLIGQGILGRLAPKLGTEIKGEKCGGRVSGRSCNILIECLEEAVSNPETRSLEKSSFKTRCVYV